MSYSCKQLHFVSAVARCLLIFLPMNFAVVEMIALLAITSLIQVLNEFHKAKPLASRAFCKGGMERSGRRIGKEKQKSGWASRLCSPNNLSETLVISYDYFLNCIFIFSVTKHHLPCMSVMKLDSPSPYSSCFVQTHWANN